MSNLGPPPKPLMRCLSVRRLHFAVHKSQNTFIGQVHKYHPKHEESLALIFAP
jgi:hypothetical protein